MVVLLLYFINKSKLLLTKVNIITLLARFEYMPRKSLSVRSIIETVVRLISYAHGGVFKCRNGQMISFR